MIEQYVLKEICGEKKIYQKNHDAPLTEEEIVERLNRYYDQNKRLIIENEILNHPEWGGNR